MSGPRGTRDWDAGTYERVSGPQLSWGSALLDRLELSGDETVIDAGCGTGRVSELILERIPRGRLICVDGSEAMCATAAERFGDRAEVIHSDLLELELPRPVDAVFSSATFHWVLDHDRLFERIASWLRPGGRLQAQCGGEGNVERFFRIAEEVASEEPFAPHIGDLPDSRHFASPEATELRLTSAGFTDPECWLEPQPTRPDEPREFIAAVCLGAHTSALPDELRDGYVDAVHERWASDPTLDYVRLNISARRA